VLPSIGVSWLGESWLRTLGYALAAGAALLAGWREERGPPGVGRWPTFWFLSAAVLGSMAVVRAFDLGDLLTRLGRDEARRLGWYQDRRRLQAIVVGAIGGGWTITIAVALWLVPERRRRYLPAALVTFSLMCFSAVRLISLHHLDALLERRELVSVQVGDWVELVLLALAVALALLARPFAVQRAPAP